MDQRLSTISTKWSVLRCAHGEDADAAAEAWEVLVERYGGAVRRYLRKAARDAAEADDLYQEFALRLVRGAFRNAQPQKGRFRDYIKVVLFHLVRQHRKRLQRVPQPLPPGAAALGALAAPDEDCDRAFDRSWREDLLARVWEALAVAQPAFHTVLRFRADNPDMPSPKMADELGRRLGEPVTAGAVRQTLRRARKLFARLLRDEVSRSLHSPTPELLEQELEALNLLRYCRPAPKKRAAKR